MSELAGMTEDRVAERFPAGIRVAYRIDGKGHPGKLLNVSTKGGFVAAKTMPARGRRLQLAVVLNNNSEPVWLDLRVTWVNDEPKGNMPVPGFGGKWLAACSKQSEAHLKEFMGEVLGVTDLDVTTKSAATSA